MKDGRISAIGFGGGAGLNGRTECVVRRVLTFLVALVSPVFVVATLGARDLLD